MNLRNGGGLPGKQPREQPILYPASRTVKTFPISKFSSPSCAGKPHWAKPGLRRTWGKISCSSAEAIPTGAMRATDAFGERARPTPWVKSTLGDIRCTEGVSEGQAYRRHLCCLFQPVMGKKK